MIPSDDTYRTRRAGAREYFSKIPEVSIDLNIYGLQLLKAEGLGHKCGAVGCVAGWLQTMPEFRAWQKGHHGLANVIIQYEDEEDALPLYQPNFWRIADRLCIFLGIEINTDILRDHELFSPRKRQDILQKHEAMDRLDRLQTMPIIGYKETP